MVNPFERVTPNFYSPWQKSTVFLRFYDKGKDNQKIKILYKSFNTTFCHKSTLLQREKEKEKKREVHKRKGDIVFFYL